MALQRKGLRGSAARGRTYERKVLKELERRFPSRSLLAHRWLGYQLEGRQRFAQPDAVVLGEDWLLLAEAKLSHTLQAFDQLARYAALLEVLYPGRRIVQLEVCKNLRAGVGPFLVKDPENALAQPCAGPWVFHWLPIGQ